MILKNCILRKFGGLFLLVDIETNKLFKVNELVYDLMSVREEQEDSPKMSDVLKKYNLSENKYDDHISRIVGQIQ
jgi:hypothetical protein